MAETILQDIFDLASEFPRLCAMIQGFKRDEVLANCNWEAAVYPCPCAEWILGPTLRVP